MRNYIVVAESIRARIFKSQTNLGPLTEIKDMVNPTGRLHERQLDTDRPGRGHYAGGNTHALGNDEVTKNHEAVTFAKDIATWLEEDRVKGNFDALILVGSPQFLGMLRKSLSDNCKKMVTKSFDKSLVHASVEEIHDQIVN